MIDLIQRDYNGDVSAYVNDVLSAQDPESRLFIDYETAINSLTYEEVVDGAARILAENLLFQDDFYSAAAAYVKGETSHQTALVQRYILQFKEPRPKICSDVFNLLTENEQFKEREDECLIDKFKQLKIYPITEKTKQDINERRAQILEEKKTARLEDLTKINNALKVRDLTKPANNISELLLSLDKGNSKVWNLKATDSKQLFFDFKINTLASKDKKGADEANILCSIDFNALEGLSLSKRLTAFDRHVYRAIDALVTAGHEYFTISQVCAVMGYTKSPNQTQIKKVKDSCDKMLKTTITIDNQAENTKYKNYKRFKYDGALLPVEMVTGEYQRVKGKTRTTETTTLIHPLRTLPLLEFARGRGQVTIIKREVFANIESKTENTLSLNDYLFTRIAHMRSGKANSNKILLSSVYASFGDLDRKQKSRLKDKIDDLLEIYKRLKYIKAYTYQDDGYIIAL